MFQQIIDLLLQEKANLDGEMALDIEVAVNAIKAKYAEQSEKVDAMLSLAGYVEPVPEPIEETDTEEVTEPVEEVVDEVEATEAESGETLYTL